jgi:ribosomal protein S12 methylthiotransferase accessory factor
MYGVPPHCEPLSYDMKVDIAELLGPKLARAVDPRVGIVKALRPVIKGIVDPHPPYIVEADPANYMYATAAHAALASAGKGRTLREAMVGAVGEALERYCAYWIDPNRQHRDTYKGLGPRAIDPSDFVLYSPAQYRQPHFPFAPYSGDTPLSWVEANSLTRGITVLVPTIMTYLRPAWESPAEHLLEPTSNGLAAGPTLPFALLSGLYEVIERDAFLVTWLRKVPPRVLHVSAAMPFARAIIDHYQRHGVSIYVLALQSDIQCHVIMTVAVADGPEVGPAAVVGLGCDLDPVAAIDKSLMELCQARPGEAVRFAQGLSEGLTPSTVVEIQDHSGLYHSRDFLPALEWLWRGATQSAAVDLPSYGSGNVEQNISVLVREVESVGGEAVYVDLTSSDVESVGVHVVRVLCTRLQPIAFGYGLDRLAGPRLLDATVRPRFRGTTGLNHYPHPLA